LDLIVSSEEERRYTAIIDEILGSSDLNTISAKAIRKGLQEKVEDDVNAKKVGSYAQIQEDVH
jgi:upstream activation factor subunit UAF30